MDSNVVRNSILNEKYITINHISGLKIILYPMMEYNSAYAIFGTKYGSIDNIFKSSQDKDFVEVPKGIAHFLEHKLFETENGDAFSLFAKTGASANAFTTFDKTCYLFSCTENFTESLKILLEFVRTPYFSKNSIKKEQGIIEQEIKMYDDSGDWRVFFNLLSALYHNNPVKIDIAGTVESIKNINEELLYKCYNTFYNLNNMILVISGKFKSDDVISVIDNVIDKQDSSIKIDRMPIDEPLEIVKPKIEQNLDVSVPLFNIGYKSKPYKGYEKIIAELEAKILVDMIVSDSLPFYKRLYDSGLINSTFSSEVFSGDSYFTIIFSGESKNPTEVYNQLKFEIDIFKIKGINENTLKRYKKAMYGRYIKMFSNVELVANSLINAEFNEYCIYDTLDIIKNFNSASLTSRFNEIFNNDLSAISIVNPI